MKDLLTAVALDWWGSTGFNGTLEQAELAKKYRPTQFDNVDNFEDNVRYIFIKHVLNDNIYRLNIMESWWKVLSTEYIDELLRRYGMYDIYHKHDNGFTEDDLQKLFNEHFKLNNNVKNFQKLVLQYYTDCGEYTIPFEYKSKKQFILDVIDGKINLRDKFGITQSIDEICDDIYTLDEWFNSNKK